MKHFLSILLIIICCVGLSSCDKKQEAISNLEAFTDDITENAQTYTPEQWDEVEAEFEGIIQELDQYEYTAEEQRKIGRLKARCVKAMSQKTINNLQYQVNSIINQIQGAIEEFTGGSDDE